MNHRDPHQEASRLHSLTGGSKEALNILRSQFSVLQTRAQLLLTVCTLSLTITGFSGPRIAAAGNFQRYAMAVGLVLVLCSMLLILWGSLRIKWVTQFDAEDDVELLARIIEHRDRKTKVFLIETCLLVCGLSCYVAAVVAYFLFGVQPPV